MQSNKNDNNFNDSECKKGCNWYSPEFIINDTINLLEILLIFAKQQKKERTMLTKHHLFLYYSILNEASAILEIIAAISAKVIFL